MKLLVADTLGKAGMIELEKEKNIQVDAKPGIKLEELKKIIGEYQAIIIRSGTTLTAEILEAATNLRVIGRAGVGVDNVDLEAATKRGVIVMNTPEGNTISTAEHTFTMLMALARNIPQACQSVKNGEWKRQAFIGAELNGKVLGIVGFGRIGREVAKRAAAFNMRGVIALEINQLDVAKQNFQKALELFPDFSLAKSNLEKVTPSDKKQTQEKKN